MRAAALAALIFVSAAATACDAPQTDETFMDEFRRACYTQARQALFSAMTASVNGRADIAVLEFSNFESTTENPLPPRVENVMTGYARLAQACAEQFEESWSNLVD